MLNILLFFRILNVLSSVLSYKRATFLSASCIFDCGLKKFAYVFPFSPYSPIYLGLGIT